MDILEASAAAHPDAPALDDGERPLTYAELLLAVGEAAHRLRAAGLGAGDRIGIRIPSGTRGLYIGILATLSIGAAYVPVDADDPEERARLVFSEAGVAAVLGARGAIDSLREGPHPGPARAAAPGDDAWVIFTSGSTGTPKGVAITHRSAAAFVDAESRIFLAAGPLGPGDRVLAGLSVAFDASCEEMWLAWAHAACLVPAPRALVRSGMDLGPWLVTRGVTVVSTVPTLAALWPAEALENVRLLIFGGEACPPELAARLAVTGREVWNTYGPTEATVVACASRMDGSGPVRIGLPLEGWDLAVVDAEGVPVAPGQSGELIIGGVGLGRYLDPGKDAEKYAPFESLGWQRAYRSGDLVQADPEGLIFLGRLDEQVKLGGRRIELGEIDAALQSLPGVSGAAAAVKTTAAGNQVLVGYLAADPTYDTPAARERLAGMLPAPLIPLLAVVDTLPTKTSGKVDRHALPWPLAGAAETEGELPELGEDARWVIERWTGVLGTPVTSLDADFFASGGGSLAAAQLVSALRERHRTVAVADIYSHPRLGSLIEALGAGSDEPVEVRAVARTTRKAQVFQTLMGVPTFILVGMRWLVYLAAGNNVLGALGVFTEAPRLSWWAVGALWLLFASSPGRMLISVAAARTLLRNLEPGSYPRSGKVHLRLWMAQQVADLADPVSLGSAHWIQWYARALGATVGTGVQLHSIPPVTGLLSVGHGASIEPEVDLTGYWIDGDRVHVGSVEVGAGAIVGARSTLMPGSVLAEGVVLAAGSALAGSTKAHSAYSGSPATRTGKAKPQWPAEAGARGAGRGRRAVYALASAALGALPLLSIAGAVCVAALLLRGQESLHDSPARLALAVPAAALTWFLLNMLLVLAATRLLGLGLREGWHRVDSRTGWQVWATERLLDMARDLLFPLYASLFTPVWLRLLGAKVGRNVEASTVLLIPKMTTIASGAFLADDTMVATYELGGGWMKVGRAKIGKRAFLGNSGIAGAGRRVPRNGLVAVLSATPAKAKAGTSWLGSPPVRLRRTAVAADDSVTYAPPLRLKVARALWELCRFVPVVVTVGVAALVLVLLDVLAAGYGYLVAALLSGAVMLAAGAVAAASAVAAKWLLVGPIRPGEHALWSSFIWRNEVVDTFIEMVCAPWFAHAAAGSPALVWWLRALGARIGHGVWCESYWLPEADLVTLGDGATVNRGTVVQTHLFHDRVMAIDTVELSAGSTLGPHGVILPAASLAAGATVGPGSLVMRGDSVPPSSYWMGNPVQPWSPPQP
ncbi:Pls/PosA family non-ribosomal peptide synthetase [Paeniglutamicibacter sp. R2-26]|uniref:Pls/PosA family non-ribosomal peptide synthetase n=1 Tax=Paeniglutamicibacter sp. R2-26 TaxID=3144417 RepID=UPI003EE7ABB7